MGLFNDLFSNDQNKKSKAFGLLSYLKEQENELTEEEQKAKQDGDYEDYNFEYDELEDDDYYFEDEE